MKNKYLPSGICAGLLFCVLLFAKQSIIISVGIAVISYIIFALFIFAEKKSKVTLSFDGMKDAEISAALIKAEKEMAEFKKLSLNCAKVDMRVKSEELYDICSAIVKNVSQNKSKYSLCSNFFSYYLPNTLDVMKSYRQIEVNGLKGKESLKYKEKTEAFFDEAKIAFGNILENIFRGETMDNSVDIDVMLSSLKSEGLIKADDFNLRF